MNDKLADYPLLCFSSNPNSSSRFVRKLLTDCVVERKTSFAVKMVSCVGKHLVVRTVPAPTTSNREIEDSLTCRPKSLVPFLSVQTLWK